MTITSLLSILLATLHLADDIVRGFEPGGFKNVSGIMIMSGYVIMLLGSLLGTVMPLARMRGAELVGGRIANSSGQFFWVWTMMSLGVTSMFSLALSAGALWSLPWRRQP